MQSALARPRDVLPRRQPHRRRVETLIRGVVWKTMQYILGKGKANRTPSFSHHHTSPAVDHGRLLSVKSTRETV